jgi:hypothetical protein
MPENQGTQVNKNIAQELLGELAHGTHNAHFEVRGDGIYRGDRLIIPIVIEYVNVIDDVGGPRYVVRFKVTAPPMELTCDGDLDEVYECVKSHVYVLESHIARNALMYALFKWTREHDSPEQPQTKVAAMDAFRELVNKILSTAQQVYARLKPSSIEAPGSPHELFNIIQAHPAVLEVIQTVAYGSKVTIDGMLCIPIETLKNKGINVDELPMVDYQELTEVMKSGEFWDTLRQLNINANTTDAQQLSRLLRPSIHQHVNANDRVTKAIKALTGGTPIKRKVKTPQGRVLWAVCTTPPEAIDNDQQNNGGSNGSENGSEARTETHSDKALVTASSATVGATVPATVGSTVNQGESTGQGDTQRSRVFKGQVSLRAFMPQEGSKQASKQVNSKPVEGGVDVSEILRPEVVLKPINDPEALRRAVREFFEPWIIEEPDPRWLRVKRKYTMKLVEAVDKAKSIEELNEMIARIEAEESQELAQLEKELKKQNAKH